MRPFRRSSTGPVLAAALALSALPGAAETPPPADDPHLSALPRTEAEAARIAAVTAQASSFDAPEPFETMPGGASSVRARTTADAFSQPSGNMGFDREMPFKLGNGLFRKLWVPAPSSTRASDGLGPLFNARACQNCHIKDGRGHPPATGEPAVSMVLRLSRARPGETAIDAPAIEDWLASQPDPQFGEQLQTFAAPGHAAEGALAIRYRPRTVTLSGGEVVTLREPTYAIDTGGRGKPPPGLMLSPRVAPAMIGLGLLEAIPAADILAHADPDDADGDGISGRPNVVLSREFGRPMLGRFGLKAGVATVREQSAAAFSADMGLSNPLFPDPWGDCTAAQAECRAAPDGQEDGLRDGLEVDAASLDLVTFYARNLAVPERRGAGEAEVLAGKAAFAALGCGSCHVPKFVTHRLTDRPEQSFQLIWPYTDLLLHDMGEGLADHRPEGRATGREWRTAPLWGIGLATQVNGEARFLHDGRARSLTEAILWHGGEAQAARDGFVALPPGDRAALIRFLESL